MANAVIDLTFETVDMENYNQADIDSDAAIARELMEYEIDFLGFQPPIQAQMARIMQNPIARRPRPRAQTIPRPRAQLRPKAVKTAKAPRALTFQQDPNQECCICYEKLSQERSTRLKCGHVYHTLCIRKWGHTKMECPMDRKKIRASELK